MSSTPSLLSRIDLSLPSKPTRESNSNTSFAASSSSNPPPPAAAEPTQSQPDTFTTTSTSRQPFALPARPTFAPPDSALSSTRTRGLRNSSLSPPPRDDVYIPPRSPSRDDIYIPPSPRRYRSPPRRRSPSPPPRRYRSPTPPSRRYTHTRTHTRNHSHSQTPSRTRSPSRSHSPTKRPRSPSLSPRREDRADVPKTFFTFSHIKAEQRKQREEERAAAREEKVRARAEQHKGRDQREQDSWAKYFDQQKRDEEQSKNGHRDLRERIGPREQAAESSKRARSPSPLASEPPAKVAKPIPSGPRIPTGPRATSGLLNARSLPTGPRADRSIPTGPRGAPPSEPYRPETLPIDEQSTEPPFRTPRSESPESSDMSPGGGRYRGRPNGGAAKRPTATRPTATKTLPGPLWSHDQIMASYSGGVALKPQWAENPKSPLANYLGGGAGGATNLGEGGKQYDVEEGLVEGKKVFRVTVSGDPQRGIVGVGDHANKKEAEKLAALSAVLQLASAGLLEQGRGKTGGTSTPASVSMPSAGPGETAKLSDGSEITYDRARQFMEYYCQRYKFGKPDIDFSQSTTKSAKRGKMGNTVWDAVITVGGRKIGMGSATSKKGAQVKCYLDVTQYLESCDPDLWRDFIDYSKKDQSANLGMAPHLVFQMSDNLNDDVQGLCSDIRHSRLYKNAPPLGVATSEAQPLPVWQSGRLSSARPSELEAKSLALQDKLAAYHSDPRMDKMRQQREALPVTAKATDILAKIEVNDVTIVMAATGSGKTTQIPQLLFDDYINRGEGAKCNIICTQPRRLAAMSVAERISDERGDPLGKEVGYQVRFDAKLPQPNGSITFCTTGIFLKRMQSSLGGTADTAAVAQMDQVTHIVVDEVHERDIDTDLSLVVLKRLLADRKARNKPIKIILMSATIDPTLFQTYFADSRGRLAPVAEVPGRTFPVERHYLDDIVPDLRNGLPQAMGGWVFQEKSVGEYLNRELSRDQSLFSPITGMELEIPYPLVALTIAYVMQRSDDGHVLVFLPGWDEIKKVADILLDPSGRYPLLGVRFSDPSKYSVHYLHSTIPAAEQREVFKPPPKGVRRIILATNIAETSITIPDVVYVVDTGRVKEKRYDPERHMSSLVSAWVGASNLNQRAGRAGRHREGEYYGLVSRMRYESLDPHQMVEMKRSDLSNVVMHVKALNLGEVEDVLAATIEPPEPNRIVAAMETLHMLGALDSLKNLTSLGRVLLQLPVEAAIGKLCLYGSFFRCLDSALTLAAVLTNRDPFLAPPLRKKEADEIKDSWSPLAFRSDPLAIVAAYNAWSAIDDRRDYHAANQFCGDNFLSKPTLQQIKQVKGSLLQSLDQAGVIAVSAGGAVGRIGRQHVVPPQLNEHGQSLPLLAALIALASAPNFALRTSEKTCRTAQDKTVFIHPSSVNSRKREAGGPEEPSASFNPAEKRLYAFGEKARNVPLGGNPNNAITQLRNVTRLDPMTYMLFGAYELVVTQRGLECDRWLPVVGNLHALDDVQRLKTLLDGCMLRVFEGVGKSLTRGRDARFVHSRKAVDVRAAGSSRIVDEELEEEGENESDEEGDVDDPMNPNSGRTKGGAGIGNGAGAGAGAEKKRTVGPLAEDEIKELEMLTTDVVRVLNAYAAEREGGSTYPSRPASPSGGRPISRPASRGVGGYEAYGQAQVQGSGAGAYRPPATRRW